MADLPTVHPSAYIDPLRASGKREAIGVCETNGILLAIGDETTEGEWIRMER